MPPAAAEYDNLGDAIRERVDIALCRFATKGLGDVKRLQGLREPRCRLRVGDYRVQFTLPVGTDDIVVLSVRRRDVAYRGLVREDVAAYTAAATGDAGA